MARLRFSWLVCLVLSGLMLTSTGWAQDRNPASLWEDFIHYTRVARVDLAASSGQALLQQDLTAEQLLQIVEQGPYADYEQTLRRAQRMEGPIAQVAQQVSQRIEQAQLELARDPQRIRQDIEALDDGLRARMNAIRRLQEAGQFAAPALLQVLLNEQDENLRPYVLEAMVEVGRPIVSPLSQALHEVPPVVQQQLSRVLSRIGYPLALPYLKALATNPDTTEETRQVAQRAVVELADRANVPANLSAAEMFLVLAGDYYAAQPSLILQPNAPYNIMWQYRSDLGLTPMQIPTEVFPDVMAMRAARRSLDLNPDMARALSLWLAANFRRENNLPAGENDPSYGPEMRSPMFYATVAGPRHIHPVLDLALQGNDAALALDAIRALAATAGSQSLIDSGMQSQPLLRALNYPDQRVRIETALAIAQGNPQQSFPGSSRVVPVLVEAFRQAGQKYAAVIAEDQETLNQVASQVRQAGDYEVLTGSSLEEVRQQMQSVAGLDLLVVSGSESAVTQTYDQAQQSGALQATPVVMLAQGNALTALNNRFGDDAGVVVTDVQAPADQVSNAIQQVTQAVAGQPIDPQQATRYALAALDLLRDLALRSSDVFNIEDAKVGLIQALNDRRPEIVLAAADVLKLLNDAQAQQALASAALNVNRDLAMRIELLSDLATSARRWGAMVTQEQAQTILEQMTQAEPGQLADALAKVHGALNLPTAHAVEFITGQ